MVNHVKRSTEIEQRSTEIEPDASRSFAFIRRSVSVFVNSYHPHCSYICDTVQHTVRRCGVVGSILAFGCIGHGFESEHHLFSHQSASAFSKLRSLAKCSLDDSVRRLL